MWGLTINILQETRTTLYAQEEAAHRGVKDEIWPLPLYGPLVFSTGLVRGRCSGIVGKIEALSNAQLASKSPLELCRHLGMTAQDVADDLTYNEGYTRRPPALGPRLFDQVICLLVSRYRDALVHEGRVDPRNYDCVIQEWGRAVWEILDKWRNERPVRLGSDHFSPGS